MGNSTSLILPRSTHEKLEMASTLYPKLPQDLIKMIVEYHDKVKHLTGRVTSPYGSYGKRKEGTFICPECKAKMQFHYRATSEEHAETETILADVVRDHLLTHEPDCEIYVYNVVGSRML